MEKKELKVWLIIVGVVAGLLAIVLICLGAYLILSKDNSVAPAASAGPTPTKSTDLEVAAMELAWNEMTYTEQSNLCASFNQYPELMHDIVTEEVYINKSKFYEFFNGKC